MSDDRLARLCAAIPADYAARTLTAEVRSGASVAARGWFAASADWRRAAAAVETLRAQIGRAVEARRDEIAGLS